MDIEARKRMPYPPSWVDRLTDWLDTRRIPSPLVHLVIYLSIVTMNHLATWLFGTGEWWQVEYEQFVYPLFTVESLFLLKFLDKDALSALDKYRPMLAATEAEYRNLQYRLTHLPARPVLLLTALGAILGSISGYSTALFLGEGSSNSTESVYNMIGFFVPMTLALVFCYRIVVQLRTVSRLYASAPEVDLYNLSPIYALSSHTARTGLTFLFLVYSNILLAPGSIENPTTLIPAILISVLASLAFLLPLRGVNRRLEAEKSQMMAEINERIKVGFNRLERQFDQSALDEIGNLQKAIATLERQKAFIEAIPTWPWKAATLRGFVSAMVLPIVIWIIQQVLDRVLL